MQIQTKIWIGSAVAAAAVSGAMGAGAKTDNVTLIPAAVMANFITAGLVDPNGKVPAVNAVPGAGVPTLYIAAAVLILSLGGEVGPFLWRRAGPVRRKWAMEGWGEAWRRPV